MELQMDSSGRHKFDDELRQFGVAAFQMQFPAVGKDSAVKAATNEQQWYVTISRGRKGVKIFTADKGQLRENISRGGARTLALDMKPGAFQKLATVWGRDVALRQAEAATQSLAVKPTESVKPTEKPTETVKPPVEKPETVRRRIEIKPTQNPQKTRGMRI